MFTGLIEDKGIIVERKTDLLVVRTALDDVHIGDSVAINGVCLTAATVDHHKDSNVVSFDFSHETASRTTLITLSEGCQVNLERALAAGGRMGGHILTGHVEETGTLLSAVPRGNSVTFTFSAQENVTRYIVAKGSVGIDGISLTVAGCGGGRFSVVVIPHTLSQTTFAGIKPGAVVNIEPDILAKYVEHFLARSSTPQGSITEALLKENGF